MCEFENFTPDSLRPALLLAKANNVRSSNESPPLDIYLSYFFQEHVLLYFLLILITPFTSFYLGIVDSENPYEAFFCFQFPLIFTRDIP